MRQLLIYKSNVFRFLCFLALLVLGVAGILGSGGGEDITGGGSTIASITITPSAVPDGLPVGISQQFTAIAQYTNNTQQDITSTVTWGSSNQSAASISNSGLVTALAAGVTNITAVSGSITSNQVSVEVINVSLTRIEISPAVVPDDLPLEMNQQFTALGTFTNSRSYDVTDFVSWDSTNTVAATINANTGVATGVAPGATDITASALGVNSNSVSLSVVDNKSPAELIVEPQWIGALPVNRAYQMRAFLRYSDNSSYEITDRVTWTSNDTSAAIVNNDGVAGPKGQVTALSTGGFTTKRINIIANDSPYTAFEGSATIDIASATITAVNIQTGSSDGFNSIPVGYTRDLYARGIFSDGSRLDLITSGAWTINDTTIASFVRVGDTVSVQGISPGTVTVSYVDVLADGTKSGMSGAVSLTVTDASLTAVTVTPGSDVLPPEAQAQFDADGTFAGGLVRDITKDVVWDSSNGAVAVFGSDRGKLTTLTTGNTNVTATGLNSGGTPLISTPVSGVAVQNETIQTLQIVDLGAASAATQRDYIAIASFTGGVTVDYTDRVFWSSSNVEIATVSNVPGNKGRVTFIKAGQVSLNAIVPGIGTPAIPLVVNVQ
ncbi:Ig-like domain-containing protein [Kaarinaea lacus]